MAEKRGLAPVPALDADRARDDAVEPFESSSRRNTQVPARTSTGTPSLTSSDRNAAGCSDSQPRAANTASEIGLVTAPQVHVRPLLNRKFSAECNFAQHPACPDGQNRDHQPEDDP
jgi:hypothetical protein